MLTRLEIELDGVRGSRGSQLTSLVVVMEVGPLGGEDKSFSPSEKSIRSPTLAWTSVSSTRGSSAGELASAEASVVGVLLPHESSDGPEVDDFGVFGYLAVGASASYEKNGRSSPWSACLTDFKWSSSFSTGLNVSVHSGSKHLNRVFGYDFAFLFLCQCQYKL